MDQKKIGKFIAENRKAKGLTQAQLAEKLGVSDRSVSKWENGRCMPDLSLFEPLCQELDMTVNDLLSGEKIKQEEYQEKFEKNIVNTIDYTNRQNLYQSNVFLALGGFFIIVSLSIFSSTSSWSSIGSIFGVLILLLGFAKVTKKFSHWKRVIACFCFLVLMVAILMGVDYANVERNQRPPKFTTDIITQDNIVLYKTPFYQVFEINKGTKQGYCFLDTKKEYTIDTVPVSPFNRNKSGIDRIISFKNPYIGNASNIGELIAHLPLYEFGYVYEVNTDDLELKIFYHTTDWYIDDEDYMKKALVYNAVSTCLLIDNLESITYEFSGSTYHVDKETIKKVYPHFNEILNQGNISKENFNMYLEARMNDIVFVEDIYEKNFNH